eukprot:s943_g8.t1
MRGFNDSFQVLARWQQVQHRCLRAVDLELRRSKTIVALGVSGSGKSTLLKLLADGTPEAAGEFFMDPSLRRPMQEDGNKKNKNWVWYENAVGECLKDVCGKDKVTKPKFRATDRQDNDTCHAEQHSHCSPSSKTSNPDWIMDMPDCRWVVDAKYYSASKVNAHDVDKLLSDKKSHGAKIGILMVYVDSCSLPISPNVQEMAQ